MRGHGKSDYPDDLAEYTEAQTVADMAAILDAVGAKKAVIGGLSLGGYMSLAFHLAHPERAEALLIIDTGPGYSPTSRGPAGTSPRSAAPRISRRTACRRPARGGAETRAAPHRDATGLAKAARGMLTQHDARVISALPNIQVPSLVRGRRERHAVPRRLRLHGRQDPRREEGGDRRTPATPPTSTSPTPSTPRCSASSPTCSWKPPDGRPPRRQDGGGRRRRPDARRDDRQRARHRDPFRPRGRDACCASTDGWPPPRRPPR